MSRLRSLKARLTVGVLSVVAATWLVTAAFTWFEARHEIDEVLDGHLAQAAALLVAQAGDDIDEIDTEHAPTLHKYARKVAFQVWDKGVLRLHSANAPETPLAGGRPGFSEREFDGRDWRVFTTRADDDVVVHVAERVDARRELAAELAGGLLLPLAVALPVLGLLLWLAVGHGLRALERVTAEVATRAPDKLSPLAAADMPTEVRPLAERLNDLFGRLARSLDNERRFTADAAHELRTPLAGIRAQAQVALGAADDEQRRHALEAVIAGSDRATRLVEQLLTLARLDTAPGGGRGPVPLRALAAETLAALAPAAIARDIELELADGDEASVDGHDGLLRVLLRNLADNALRYSPPGSRVVVVVAAQPDGVELAVEDDGPGIAADEREKVMQRFYRVLGSGEGGSGLGLSIVARIAEVHGARVELMDGAGGRGLRVAVRFPRAA